MGFGWNWCTESWIAEHPTTPPTMFNIPEKHSSVLKLAEQSDSEHKTFANGGGTEEGGMESEGGGACESNSDDE